VVSFTHEPETSFEQYFRQMKHEIRHWCIIACDADPEVGKSEFVLYMVKFAGNRLLTSQIDQLNAIIGQTDVFNPSDRFIDDTLNIFRRLALFFDSPKQIRDLIPSYDMPELLSQLDQQFKAEKKRLKEARESRTSIDIGDNPYYMKSQECIF